MSSLMKTALILYCSFQNSKGFAEISTIYPIRNHKTDYTKQFEYKLGDDHLISLRSLNEKNLRTFIGGDLEANPNALSWHLFDRLAYPYEKDSSLLLDGEFISEIAVASKLLVAVSNKNRVFLLRAQLKTSA